MPSVTYNGQSFAIDGKRVWILAASIQYARVPAALWPERVAAAQQAGFNTIETACPWLVHEPRQGRFSFDGDTDLRTFIETCRAAGLRVILRIGPYIGDTFDGGGLPGWLLETPNCSIREDNEIYLENVSRYFRKLLGEITDLQVTSGGPILLMQVEHAWTCSNQEQADRYLHEITRFVRESGVTVPLINANDLWQEVSGTIDTWRGYDDLLVHLRQLRTVQPQAPRLVSQFDAAVHETWGSHHRKPRGKSHHDAIEGDHDGKSPEGVLRRLAEILASGAQPVVSPFHAGTHFGFLAGRLPGGPDQFVTTSAAADPPLGEAGTRGRKFHLIRRLITFANHFGHVFAELDPDYQPIVLDPALTLEKHRPQSGKHAPALQRGDHATVVPLRGPQGKLVFVFGSHAGYSTVLVLDGGIRLPVHLGDQPVGWYALDVDLQGLGRLDYSSICPWAIIDRALVVFQGAAGSSAYISISGTPLDVIVPADGDMPVVLEHKGLTIVVCNQQHIDMAYHDDTALYVGIAGFSAEGAPLPLTRHAATGDNRAWVIRRDARVDTLLFEGDSQRGGGSRKSPRRETRLGEIKLNHWEAAPAAEYATGESPRFASLDGPETLSQCGAPFGYGWYRITLNQHGRKFCHIPQAADRVHLFNEGHRVHILGVGPGAEQGPFELKLAKNGQIVALVDNLGRFSDGNDLAQPKGMFGHIYEVKALRTAKPKFHTADPVSPFALRGFIAGRDATIMSDTRQAIWNIAHTKKTPLLVEVIGARPSGTFVLNDEPLAYYAGSTGACFASILIDPKTTESMKRGKNVLRFAPDLRQDTALDEIASATTIYECTEALTESAKWAFAKWEPPHTAAYGSAPKPQSKSSKGLPCWWRCTFAINDADRSANEAPIWLDTPGLSKGQAFINGNNLGRYFTATGSGKPVGPQVRLYIPPSWIYTERANEVIIFDEHGCEPSKVRLVRGD